MRPSQPATFDWSYSARDEKLLGLRLNALHRQWDPEVDVTWEISGVCEWPAEQFPLAGADPFRDLCADQQAAIRREFCGYMVSQLLHGEQGALVASAQLVANLPGLDAKQFASAQVADESRHVTVFDRYLREVDVPRYAVTPELDTLLSWIVHEPRWDLQVLGMNVLVEGLAMAILSTVQRTGADPLLRQICQLVLRDEARHVGFSAHALSDHVRRLTERERREREDFVYEGARLMAERLLFQPVWEQADLPVAECIHAVRHDPKQIAARRVLFANIVRTLEGIGMLSPRILALLSELGVLSAARKRASHDRGTAVCAPR